MVSTFRNGAAVALLLGASIAVQAAGLGKLTVNSALGQVLDAEIDLVSLQPGEVDSLSARVAPPESFRDARIEYTPPLRLLRFSVDKRPNGQPYLKVTSIGPINEPFVDALIEVTWPAGRIQREYPILLDPPGYSETRMAPPAVAAAAPAAPAAPAETPPAAAPAAAPSTPESPAIEPTGSPSAQAEMAAGKGETQAAASDTYGPVEKGENLSKIAGQVKPADVSLEQMLVALYRQNQDAFSGSNMNRLKTGQILKVPTAEEVAQITPTEAGKEIRTQVEDWNKYREQLAGGVSSIPSLGESSNAAKGRVSSAAVAPPAVPSAEPKDTLRLSKSEGGKGAGAKGSSQDRLNALQEEVTAKDKALKEAQSRVSDLEKQIREMQRLLDLKAGVPGKPAESKVAEAAPPKLPEPAKAPEVKPPEKPAETAKAPELPAAATKPPEPEVAAATPKAPPPKVAEKPKAPPKKAPPPPPKGMMDELMDNPAYLAAGVGAIALLGVGGFIFMRRRRDRGDRGPDSAMTSAFPSDLKPGASTGKPAGGLVDTGNSSFLTDFDKTGPGTIDTDEVDPVAEAEVYIAYGRDAQAEEILKEAMARDKSRHEIALKLLEIYHARKSATAFETVAKELRTAVGDSHPMWQKAAAMGAQIDPTNPLYVAAAGGTATFTAMSSPAAPAASPPKPDLDFDLDTSSSAGGAVIADTGAGAPTPSFDLDLDAQKSAPDLPVETSSGMDFDLAPSAPAAHSEAPAAAKDEKPAFDFDLSGLDFPGSKAAEQPRAAAAAAGGMEMADLSLESSGGEAGGEAIGTKLELAKAYLEIGDKDGAREILQEVAKEGSSSQQEEAKKLIASL